ncbi:hypothetical protein NC651_034507 [Populus alba x Populus x berolinensis]|nr:hypothetical protein NC651_034507 [Populus alba x Populus x berolinensis]
MAKNRLLVCPAMPIKAREDEDGLQGSNSFSNLLRINLRHKIILKFGSIYR